MHSEHPDFSWVSAMSLRVGKALQDQTSASQPSPAPRGPRIEKDMT